MRYLLHLHQYHRYLLILHPDIRQACLTQYLLHRRHHLLFNFYHRRQEDYRILVRHRSQRMGQQVVRCSCHLVRIGDALHLIGQGTHRMRLVLTERMPTPLLPLRMTSLRTRGRNLPRHNYILTLFPSYLGPLHLPLHYLCHLFQHFDSPRPSTREDCNRQLRDGMLRSARGGLRI